MSLFFNTDAGHRLIDNVNLVPEFIGKVTLNPTPIISNDGAENSYLAYRYSGVLPPTNGRPYMVFWTLPVSMADMWWWPQDQFGFPGSGLIYTGIDAFFAASTPAPAVLPEAYVFSLAEIEISNAPIAVRLWNTAGKLLFDSGKVHLAIQQIAAGINVSSIESSLALPSLPGKPAFLVPSIMRNREYYSSRASSARFTEWLACYRRTGGNVKVKMVETSNFDIPPSNTHGYFEDQTYGNTSGLVLPVIDASLYE
ncbi:hypothetical protein P9875_19095 [Janthinobacterium rivuli]|uniref:Uncharacterized protein n=1 Tax=Janthinobacterium rivuli TaxID=2751478 RepID=A0ABY8HYW7_9BURK|nr:hypothetical protein [Janthinobacterium rivuli]WFR77824.1 hypothetical protein P9875_19095 [Janthinobacterium rivuli]